MTEPLPPLPPLPPAAPPGAPWWIVLVPDVRGWATLGLFLLVFFIVALIAFVPSVGTNELFKTIATLLLASGGFGLLLAFLWGGSRASVAAADTVNEMAKRQPPTTP